MKNMLGKYAENMFDLLNFESFLIKKFKRT